MSLQTFLGDEDLVFYSQPSKKEQPLPLPADSLPTNWQPLEIDNSQPHGEPQLPEGVDPADALQVFQLFFDDKLLDQIAYHTNQQAEKLYNNNARRPRE